MCRGFLLWVPRLFCLLCQRNSSHPAVVKSLHPQFPLAPSTKQSRCLSWLQPVLREPVHMARRTKPHWHIEAKHVNSTSWPFSPPPYDVSYAKTPGPEVGSHRQVVREPPMPCPFRGVCSPFPGACVCSNPSSLSLSAGVILAKAQDTGSPSLPILITSLPLTFHSGSQDVGHDPNYHDSLTITDPIISYGVAFFRGVALL